jgi:hypothetical protein
MGTLIALLGLVGGMVLWAFFTFPPAYANKRAVNIFNWASVALCSMLCLIWVLNVNMMFTSPAIEKYRTFFLWGGGLCIESVFLLIFFLLRNFWIFKPKHPGGRR